MSVQLFTTFGTPCDPVFCWLTAHPHTGSFKPTLEVPPTMLSDPLRAESGDKGVKYGLIAVGELCLACVIALVSAPPCASLYGTTLSARHGMYCRVPVV